MISKELALNGIYPGSNTYCIASFGYSFIEIVVEDSYNGSNYIENDITNKTKVITIYVRSSLGIHSKSIEVKDVTYTRIKFVINTIKKIKKIVEVIGFFKSQLKNHN